MSVQPGKYIELSVRVITPGASQVPFDSRLSIPVDEKDLGPVVDSWLQIMRSAVHLARGEPDPPQMIFNPEKHLP